MAVNEPPSRELRIQQAAYLSARYGMSQEEIGRRLGGMSQSHVSRLLTQAHDMGLLVTELRFNEDLVPPERMLLVRRILETEELSPLLEKYAFGTGGIVPGLAVFDAGPRGVGEEGIKTQARRFGKAACGRLVELLATAQVAGVAWGRTLNYLVDALAGAMPRGPRRFVQFVPICAELVALDDPDYSSSWVAARLDHIVNQDQGSRLLLSGIPAFIPKRYDPIKARALREYVRETASYERIFIGPDCLADRMDLLVTSVGSATAPVRGSTAELLMAAGMTQEKLQELVVGDMGGVLIPLPTLTPDSRRLVDEINDMWTGLNLERLSAVARRAAGTRGHGGNVVVAFGKEKAGSVLEAIRMGLINELIIDRELENAMLAALRKR